MIASIRPLSGKYYGTIIDVKTDSGDETIVKVWIASGAPSDRELSLSGFTRQQWDENTEIDDGWGGKSPIRQELICDSHYECDQTYKLARIIEKAINEA